MKPRSRGGPQYWSRNYTFILGKTFGELCCDNPRDGDGDRYLPDCVNYTLRGVLTLGYFQQRSIIVSHTHNIYLTSQLYT